MYPESISDGAAWGQKIENRRIASYPYPLETRAVPFWLQLFSNPNTNLPGTKIALLDAQDDIFKIIRINKLFLVLDTRHLS